MRTDTGVVAVALRDIWEKEGELDPEKVVELAQPKAHPLHGYFEWDDDVAAHLHRVEQARLLIRSVRVVIIPEDEAEALRVRAWTAARSIGQGHGYVPTDEVRENPQQRELLLRKMTREWTSLRRRYQHLVEFWELVDSEVARTKQEAS